MAYQLVGYSFRGQAVPAPYLRVNSVNVTRGASMATISRIPSRASQFADVTVSIYASEAAKTGNLPPLESRKVTFADTTAPAPVRNDFTTYFGTAAAAGSSAAAATTPEDVLVAEAYDAIPHHPDLAVLLAGATVV